MNYEQETEKSNNRKWLIVLLIFLIPATGALVFGISREFGESKKPVSPGSTPEKMLITITDDDGKWDADGSSETEHGVFVVTNTSRKYVAPYDTGVYHFEVKNTKNRNIYYDLTLEEDNADKINIKYKLKKNGDYIIGGDGWVYYNEIKLDEVAIGALGNDAYELEWSWVSENDEQDTAIGLKQDRAEYSVEIKVIAYGD